VSVSALAVLIGGVAVAGVAVATNIIVPAAVQRRDVAALRRRAVERRAVALTYDDGPGPRLTPRVLEVLAAHGAPATFFMLGCRAERAPELVGHLLEQGHDVGCHTRQHLNAWKSLPGRAVADIDGGYRAMSKWMGPRAVFRPPYGKMTIVTRLAVRRRGAAIAWWTIDSGDTHATLPDPSVAANRLAREQGGVILMHDFDREKDREERASHVLKTTVLMLETARREGLRVCRVSELLGEVSRG